MNVKARAGFLCALLLCYAQARGEENAFLKLSSDQRYWWIHGAVTTTAHVIAAQDKAKGDCAAKWFLSDRANKQRIIEETIARYPSEGPTTIVISLLTQACGPLVTAK